MKFNVGDVLQIKEWDEMEEEYGTDYDGEIHEGGDCFTHQMKPLCGMTFTVKSSDEITGRFSSYEGIEHAKSAGGSWNIYGWMLKYKQEDVAFAAASDDEIYSFLFE